MKCTTELIVALDFADRAPAEQLVTRLGDSVSWFKVGKQMFTRYGPEFVHWLKSREKRVFLDLKFHDIPNTVAAAVEAALELGVEMVNVHAGGGPEMLRAAMATAGKRPDAWVVAVTVLTSMDDSALRAVGVGGPVAEQVVRLARLAQDCGLAGVVASAQEIELIRAACGPDFALVIPGVRPAGAARDDQRRVMTPAEAAAAGADFVVVGRPITRAPEPVAAAAGIQAELGQVNV